MKALTLLRITLSIFFIGLGVYLLTHVNPSYEHECTQFTGNNHELFDAKLSRVSDIDELGQLVESTYNDSASSSQLDSFQYMRIAKLLVKKKFYHGNAAYSWQENWICYLLGKYIWVDFNSLVSPADVARHCAAMCSQQTMVFTELMKRKGIQYRYVYLKNHKDGNGHFSCEIWLNNEWRYLDVNREIIWDGVADESEYSFDHIVKNNLYEKLYRNYPEYFQTFSYKEEISYSKPNENIGWKMILFQHVTKVLSWLMPIVLGMALILYPRRTINT